MKRQSWILLLASLVLMGAAAGLISHLRASQRLGEPGVKVIPVPIYDTKGQLVATNSAYLPEDVLNYRSEIRPVTPDTLRWLPKDTTYGQRSYKAQDGFECSLNVILMGSDRTSIHRPEWCLQGVGWAPDAGELAVIPISEPFPYQLQVMKLTASHESVLATGEKTRERVVYVYWYVADHELTAVPGQRMWWMARDMLLSGVLQRWAYVTCMSYCAPGQEESTFNRMKELIAAAVPRFQRATGAPSALARSP
jgi:hypothetical protein